MVEECLKITGSPILSEVDLLSLCPPELTWNLNVSFFLILKDEQLGAYLDQSGVSASADSPRGVSAGPPRDVGWRKKLKRLISAHPFAACRRGHDRTCLAPPCFPCASQLPIWEAARPD